MWFDAAFDVISYGQAQERRALLCLPQLREQQEKSKEQKA